MITNSYFLYLFWVLLQFKKKHLDSVGLLRKLNYGGAKAIVLVQLINGAPGGMESNEIPAPTPTKKDSSEALPRSF